MNPKPKLVFLLLTITIATPAHPQTPDPLQQIELLEVSSHFDRAISSAESLIASNTLSPPALGDAQLLLGFAYRELGQFMQARHAFEQAARLFESQNLRDGYASALDHMAILDNTAAQFSDAEREWKQSAKIFQQTGNRAALAGVYLNLAQLELNRNRVKRARKYLDEAAQTVPATGWLSTDVAHFDFTESCVYYKEGRFDAAVSGYQKTLDLVKSIAGENSFMAGSMYAYLGMSLAKQGHTDLALDDVRKGLALIESVEGRHTIRYFVAENMYVQILDLAGLHTESVQLKKQTAQALHDFLSTRCPHCSTSILSYH
jgi:tetratricopeptide (TPR) repeat protein